MELGEFGYYKDDLRQSKPAPGVPGGIRYNPFRTLDITRLKRTLNGRGIRDVDISIFMDIVDSPANLLNVQADIKYDRHKDIANHMQEELAANLY